MVEPEADPAPRDRPHSLNHLLEQAGIYTCSYERKKYAVPAGKNDEAEIGCLPAEMVNEVVKKLGSDSYLLD